MRKWLKIVEDYSQKTTDQDHEVGSLEWRNKTLEDAQDRSLADFEVLRPEETGLSQSVFASINKRCPAFIVDSGGPLSSIPHDGSKVYVIGEKTGDPKIDKWVSMNIEALVGYWNRKLDTEMFNKLMIPLKEEILMEMSNERRGKFNNPLAFFVRPEPDELSHDYRVKVSINVDTRESFEIGLRPNAHLISKT